VSAAGKLALAAAGVAVAVVLFFLLRPGDETAAPTTPTGTETGGANAEPTTGTMPLEAEPAAVRVAFEDGEVIGPRRPEFTVGDRIVLVVRSDVADHVHVHGYDLMQDVAPGAPARISFTADAQGRFEVELEDRRLPLMELVVSP
jgi:heme/copper-type cytochrome/quinol oxidase subunit 2